MDIGEDPVVPLNTPLMVVRIPTPVRKFQTFRFPSEATFLKILSALRGISFVGLIKGLLGLPKNGRRFSGTFPSPLSVSVTKTLTTAYGSMFNIGCPLTEIGPVSIPLVPKTTTTGQEYKKIPPSRIFGMS